MQYIVLPIVSLASVFIVPLVMYWYPYYHTVFRFGKCHNKTPGDADVQYVKQLIKEGTITHVVVLNANTGLWSVERLETKRLGGEGFI